MTSSSSDPVVEVRDIRYLIAVLQYGSLRETARHVYVSESALSQAIRSIERKWDVTLFRRTGHRLVPTPTLVTLNPAMQSLQDALTRLESEIRAAQNAQNLPLKIGVVALARAHVWPAIAEMLGDQMSPKVEITERGTYDVIDAVRRRQLDLGVVLYSEQYQGCDLSQVHQTVIRQGRLVVAASRTLSVARHPEISWNRLQKLPTVGFPRGYMIQDLIVQTIGPAIEDRMVLASSLGEWQMLSLQLGQGVMVLPDFCIGMLPPNSDYRIVDLVPHIPIHLAVVQTETHPLNPLAARLIRSWQTA